MVSNTFLDHHFGTGVRRWRAGVGQRPSAVFSESALFIEIQSQPSLQDSDLWITFAFSFLLNNCMVEQYAVTTSGLGVRYNCCRAYRHALAYCTRFYDSRFSVIRFVMQTPARHDGFCFCAAAGTLGSGLQISHGHTGVELLQLVVGTWSSFPNKNTHRCLTPLTVRC